MEYCLELKELRERLVRALDADEQQVLEGMLNRRLQSEYNNQVRHVNNDRQDANIELHLKDGVIHINVSSDNTTRIVSKVNLVKNIIYIDDPNILDDLDDYGIMRTRQRHKTKLVEKLDYKYKPDLSAVDGIIIDERIKRIEERLKDINLGELDFSTDYGYQYRDASLKEGISLENLSMGLKSYVILKTLLEKSVIEDNGILILDEPEIHLHPEWMRLYAEIVVLLQKEFGLNIVISTHSSDFLGFIELFATKNGIVDKCKYYMLNNSKEGSEYSEIEDVSENVDKIYDMLGKPFIEASEELGRLNETV